MKTNRNCPAFNRSVAVAPTDQELEQHEAELSSQSDIVKVEGTKVILNRAVVERVAEFRRKSLLLKFPKDAMRKRRRGPQDEDLDYLETRKSVQRRKTSPEVKGAVLWGWGLNQGVGGGVREAYVHVRTYFKR